MSWEIPGNPPKNPYFGLFPGFNESFYRSVVGSFHLGREKAGGQLLEFPVVFYAFAALALS